MGAPALRAGAPSQRRPAPQGRWPPPKKKVYNGKWYYTLQASCKAMRRTSGGLTWPSLLTVKV
jgi:hypothetical protein